MVYYLFKKLEGAFGWFGLRLEDGWLPVIE